MQFAQAGAAQEGRRGVIFDCSSRGDSQSHAEYARRMFDWQLAAVDAEQQVDVEQISLPRRTRSVPATATTCTSSTTTAAA